MLSLTFPAYKIDNEPAQYVFVLKATGTPVASNLLRYEGVGSAHPLIWSSIPSREETVLASIPLLTKCFCLIGYLSDNECPRSQT